MSKSHNSIEEIYKIHAEMVYNLCLNYVHNIEEAEELTQNVFLKIYLKLKNFRGDSELKTWIYRITINECKDFLKSKYRKIKLKTVLSTFNINAFENVSISHEHPGQILEQTEATKLIYMAIDSLPYKQKTALILKSIEGLSQKEISKIMGMSEKAIESCLTRARMNLKIILKNKEGL